MTIIVAHRGAAAQAPENTMEAFRLGVEAGADAIELDVHLTADGQLAVIHDETLERTTDRTGRVADLTMEQIREADAGATFSRAGDSGFPFADRGLTVPTLPEVLAWLPDGVGLVIISFDEGAIERVRELDPGIKTGYLLVPTQPVEPALVWATEHGHAGVYPYEADLGMDPLPLLAQANAFGREIGCYVVNDPERMKHLAACGIWGFVTDVPDVAYAALRD
jgi:glycerophosphoryl diester phosphodiesterase